MSQTQPGSEQSELWVSMEDAVSRTGTSQRNIQDWIKAGLIKKEKKKGVTYIWVPDLVKQTPMQQVEADAETPPPAATTEVIAPNYSTGGALGLSRQLHDQLRENAQTQKEVLDKLEIVRTTIENSPGSPIDDKTAKELALLGNVFRAIHQQNEKVSTALTSQEQQLKDFHAYQQREEKLRDDLVNSNKRNSFSWTLFVLLFAALGCISYFFYQQLLSDQEIKTSIANSKVEAAREKAEEIRKEKNRDIAELKSENKKLRDEEHQKLSRLEKLNEQLKNDKLRELTELEKNNRKALAQLRNSSDLELDKIKKKNQASLDELNKKYADDLAKLRSSIDKRRMEDIESLKKNHAESSEEYKALIETLKQRLAKQDALTQELLRLSRNMDRSGGGEEVWVEVPNETTAPDGASPPEGKPGSNDAQDPEGNRGNFFFRR